jgi:hypothetical protein
MLGWARAGCWPSSPAGPVGRGARVLVGGCVELGDIGVPYLPVIEALRGLVKDPADADLVAEVTASAPGVHRLLPGGVGPTPLEVPAGLDQVQVFDAVRALLLGCAEQSAVVVVLEDLHWADRATRDLVAFLARTLRSGRVPSSWKRSPRWRYRRIRWSGSLNGRRATRSTPSSWRPPVPAMP